MSFNILEVMAYAVSRNEPGICICPPRSMTTAMVSPMARMIPRTTAVIIPEDATGTTTFFIVSHFVAPREIDASLYSLGTELRASTDSDVMVGRIMIESTVDARRMPVPVDGCRFRNIGINPSTELMDGFMLYLKVFSSTNKPNIPYTTEGIPTSSSIIGLRTLVSAGGEYSARKIAVNTLNGHAMAIVVTVNTMVPAMSASAPYSCWL